jgi:hypothetical protein
MKNKTKGLFLSVLIALSILAIIVAPVSAIPGSTTATEVTSTNPDPTASGAVVTEGNEITEVNLTVDSYTERWAGFYGNVSGSISLSDGSHDLYNWTWAAASGGEVIASTANTGIDWANLANGAVTDVDSVWGFSSGSDRAVDTFNDQDTFTIGEQTMTNAPAVITGDDTKSDYLTAITNDGANSAKNDFQFVVGIINDGTTFNGETHDFEMMVPTDETVGETYYFYVEL